MIKQDIIDGAEKIFFLNGIENSTMDDLAREAEFSKRTIYKYFKSKHQIHIAIMIRGYEKLNEIIEKALFEKNYENGLSRLGVLGNAFVQFYNEYPNYFRVIVDYETTDNDFYTKDKDIRTCYFKGETISEYLKQALKEGVEDGSIQEDIDVNSTAIFLWGSVIGILNTIDKKEEYLTRCYGEDREKLFRNMIAFLLRSIKNY